MIEGKIIGINEVKKALKGLEKKTSDESQKIMNVYSRLMQTRMRDKYMSGGTIKARTGRLRASVLPINATRQPRI